MIPRRLAASDMHNLVKEFTAYLREERMRGKATIKRYVAVLDEFTGFLAERANGAGIALEAVEKAQLVEFLREGAQAPREPSRSLWNTRLAALRAFYDYLFKVEVVTVNPAQRIDRLKTNPREPVPLSLDEFLGLVEAMAQAPVSYRTRNVAIVQVLFHCALRVSELVSLEVGQVDFENYVFANVRTKGKKWLSVPFNDLVAEALERCLKNRKRLGAAEEETALFLSDRGTRLSVRSVQGLIRSYAKLAGISRPVTPHLLRHSGATELADLGTPLRVVQEICGHASITTTQRYVHVKGTARRQAINALGRQVAKRARQRERGESQPEVTG